jgi:6-pyruvoyltetrahydropterin/6-carboxytetrahydropterin synthase
MRVRRRFCFDSAHHLPNHPGKCKQLHGHSYELLVSVEGEIDAHSGMVIDFSDLKHAVREKVVDRLDHRLINDIIDNPTAERMAAWIWDELVGCVDGLVEVELYETRDCSVIHRGN